MQKVTIDFPKIEQDNKLVTLANTAYKKIITKTGEGSNFLGWVDLPLKTEKNSLKEIQNTATDFKKNKDFIVVVGIGGSYLGAKAIIDALSDNFSNLKQEKTTKIIFAGQNLNPDYLSDLINLLKNKSFGIVVISKSGTTTEPAIAFRLLYNLLKQKYNKIEIKNRIIAITDKEKGSLRELANQENFKTFIIPDDIGGRFSVLTPVGLLPISLAGFDIFKIIDGAKNIATELLNNTQSAAVKYAQIRNYLYNNGKTVEILVNYNPKLNSFAEWWKQLFGESEGKNQKGIFPASVIFTTDLHSLGQYIQDGKKQIFETIISIEKPNNDITIPKNKKDSDNLNYLSEKKISYINKMAELGTYTAHKNGEIPIIKINIPQINEYNIGQLIYFFEFSCAISAYMLGVNPFNQPGVEEYKKNMFKLLNKPGF